MRRVVIGGLMIALVGAALAGATAPRPQPILPDSLHWTSPPQLAGLSSAWVIGGEAAAGPYLLRVRLAAGARIPEHSHPDTRNTTVLTGTLWVGFGERFDSTQAVAIPEGAVLVTPAGTPHFVWARAGEVLYQEAGVGPTGTAFLGR